MKQELEIEFKNLLTEKEFNVLLSYFSINDTHFTMQENHYFDTPDFQLKNCRSALRIRKKQNQYVLTLKQPHKNGLLESHDSLSEQMAKQIISGQQTVQGEIAALIQELGINAEKLVYFGSLTTKRAEIPYESGLVVLDHSFYLNQNDYELEYEASDFQKGQEEFIRLLEQFHIPKRRTENKIRRFYEAKYLQISEE